MYVTVVFWSRNKFVSLFHYQIEIRPISTKTSLDYKGSKEEHDLRTKVELRSPISKWD